MLTDNPAAPTILLVEDDSGHIAAILRSFETTPGTYRLKIVNTLQCAQEAINQHKPALVLTDYQLPDGNGIELAELANEEFPVVLMTAKGSENVAIEAMKAGIQDYVIKSAEAFVQLPDKVNHSLKAWALVLERKQAEKALRESEEKYRMLYERLSLAAKSASFGVWDWDIATDVAIWDDTMFDIYGISKTSPLPLETWIDNVYPGNLSTTLESFKKCIEHGGRELEFRIVRPDGEVRYIFSAEGFIRNEKNEIIRIVGVSTDITKRKLAEEAQRAYARRLIEMEEELRKKLATELHDEIIRDLAVLGMNLSMISSTLGNDLSENISPRINDSARLIESISRTTRNIMSGLRPPVLDDYGLISALRWHSGLFSARNGIEVSIQYDELFPRLQTEVELAIFRISQEALMNTAKHAETKKVKITLGLDAGTVRFTVVDNGKGFIPPSMSHPQESGWGMTIMRERAELVGGKFSFDSHPGQGTAITVEIPMEGSR